MITIVAGLAAIFVAIVIIFTLFKKSGRATTVVAGMTTITICWGLVDWQLNKQLEAIICPDAEVVCSINLSVIYENPVAYEKFVRISSLGSINMKWGWIIWAVFFLLAYGIALRARKQMDSQPP